MKTTLVKIVSQFALLAFTWVIVAGYVTSIVSLVLYCLLAVVFFFDSNIRNKSFLCRLFFSLNWIPVTAVAFLKLVFPELPTSSVFMKEEEPVMRCSISDTLSK